MKFINWIISALVEMEFLFFDLYFETYDWVRPFNYVSSIFRELGYLCVDLGDFFMLFGRWVDDVTDSILDIFSFSDIYSYFRDYFTAAILAWDWVGAAWTNVINTITEWGALTKTTIEGLIAVATQGFDDLVVAWSNFWNITWPQWMSKLDNLKAAWDNFWTVTFPYLVSFTWLGIWWDSKWKEIDTLIKTWFKSYEPFWDGWQDLRDKVIEFFNDPLEFLLTKFTDWFLGPEE